MAAFPNAVKETIRMGAFLDALRTYWHTSITAIVGPNAKNYGMCSRVGNEELKLLAHYYSQFQHPNPSK